MVRPRCTHTACTPSHPAVSFPPLPSLNYSRCPTVPPGAAQRPRSLGVGMGRGFAVGREREREPPVRRLGRRRWRGGEPPCAWPSCSYNLQDEKSGGEDAESTWRRKGVYVCLGAQCCDVSGRIADNVPPRAVNFARRTTTL